MQKFFPLVLGVLFVAACGGSSDVTAPATNTAAPTTTSSATATAVPATASSGLTVSCTLDAEQLKISCRATGEREGSQLKWTSTASWANSQGSRWDFKIDELIGTGTKVFLEECQGSNCQIVETSIDTSIVQLEALAARGTTPHPSEPPAGSELAG